MSLLKRGRPASADTSGRTAAPEAVTSRLLPLLLEAVESRGRVNVLDAGSGSQSTVDFFAGRNARIHFVDLYGCELVTSPPETIDVATACRTFESYLRLPGDLKFDICLFWDTFHHMSLTALEGLSRALAPHLDRHTLGYGFGSLHSGARGMGSDSSPQAHHRYAVRDGDHLQLRPTVLPGKYHSHTQQQLDERFPAMVIQKATLLREGRLELLFARE